MIFLAQAMRQRGHHAECLVAGGWSAMAGCAGHSFEVNRRQAGMHRCWRSEPSRPGVDIVAGVGLGILMIGTEVTTGTGERSDAGFPRVLFAIESAGDVMIDTVAVAIGANHPGPQMNILVVNPPWLDPGLADGTVAVALVA